MGRRPFSHRIIGVRPLAKSFLIDFLPGAPGRRRRLLTPNSIAIIRHVVSEKRLPKVFGFFGLGAGLGAALGPFIGSLLIESFSWHSIFWVNIPFLAIALVTALVMFPKYKEETSDAPLDIIGSVLLAGSIVSIILLTKNESSLGYWVYALLILVFVPLFFRRERARNIRLLILTCLKTRPLRAPICRFC